MSKTHDDHDSSHHQAHLISPDEYEYLSSHIEANVFDLFKIVTYKSLSEDCSIPINRAKRALQQFVKQNEERVGCVYTITGSTQNSSESSVSKFLVLLVPDNQIENEKKRFSQVSGIQVYSVHKEPLKALSDLSLHHQSKILRQSFKTEPDPSPSLNSTSQISSSKSDEEMEERESERESDSESEDDDIPAPTTSASSAAPTTSVSSATKSPPKKTKPQQTNTLLSLFDAKPKIEKAPEAQHPTPAPTPVSTHTPTHHSSHPPTHPAPKTTKPSKQPANKSTIHSFFQKDTKPPPQKKAKQS